MSENGIGYISPLSSLLSMRGQSAVSATDKLNIGQLINTPAGIGAARLDWVPGTIARQLNDGLIVFRTPFGDMTARMSDLQFAVGSNVSFKIDENGKIIVKPNFPDVTPSKTIIDNSISRSIPVENMKASLLSLLTLSSGVEPVKAGLSAQSADATKILASIFPHISSGSFAFAAALYPMTVRGGLLAEAATDQEGRLKGRSHLFDTAERILISPPPRIDGSFGWLSWNMPFYEHGSLKESKWMSRDDISGGRLGSSAPKQMVVEIYLEALGKTQLRAVSDNEVIDLLIVSEQAMPESLLEELIAIAGLVGTALGVQVKTSYETGPDKLLLIKDG